MNRYTVLDLFSGAGGMSEGFLQAGFDVPYANEYSQEAAQTYLNRHRQLGYDTKLYQGDIKDLVTNERIIDFTNGSNIDVVVSRI